MSTKPDILGLATRFSGLAPDAVLLDHDYDDVLLNLDPTEFLVEVRLLEHDAATNTFAVPDTAIRILAAWYDDHQLSPETMTSLEAVSARWRDTVGTPAAYVTETEGDRFFRLYPSPDAASKPFSFIHGLPFGQDFPRYAAAVAVTETRTQVADWLDLPIALAMLAKHFTREERYRDPLFATTVRRVADRLLAMVS